jgi:hypothetical protein
MLLEDPAAPALPARFPLDRRLVLVTRRNDDPTISNAISPPAKRSEPARSLAMKKKKNPQKKKKKKK